MLHDTEDVLDSTQDPAATPSDQPSRLELARRVEATVAVLRELRSRIKRGAWRVTRRRARRQLRKVASCLEDLQRRLLDGAIDLSHSGILAHVDELDRIAHDATFASPTKQELAALRRALKVHRAAIEAN